MDIRDLNDEFFTQCILNYQVGFITLTPDNQLEFESLVTQNKYIVHPEEILVRDKVTKRYVKYKSKNMSQKSRVRARRLINKPYAYIINSGHQSLTLNGEDIEVGDVVLMSNPPIMYDDYKKFCAECHTTKIPNLKEAAEKFKQGKRGNKYFEQIYGNQNKVIENDISDGNLFGEIPQIEDIPTKPTKQTKITTNNIKRDYSFDRDKEYKNAPYIIIKKLFTENKNTKAWVFWGYLIQNKDTGETKSLPEAQIFQLASNKQIKNAKVVNRNGQNILQGIGCKLDLIEQDYYQG